MFALPPVRSDLCVSADRPKENDALGARLTSWLPGLIAVCAVLQFYLIFARQINWDEFYFLARIHDYLRGDPMPPLQTFYVHLLAWLPAIGSDAITRVEIARVLMFVLELGTLGLIYLSARRFASRTAAMLAVFSYLTCGYVLVHGASFRADPMAMFLLMAAVALLLVPRPSSLRAALAGGAVAIAILITIKAALYAPLIVAVAVLQLASPAGRLRWLLALAVGCFSAFALFAALYMLHRASIVLPDNTDAIATAAMNAKTVSAGGMILRTWPYLLEALRRNPGTFAALAIGVVLCVRRALDRKGTERLRAMALLAFAIPVASLLVYRNSFPYYYPFALAPAAILGARAFDTITSPVLKRGWILVCVTSLVVQFSAALHSARPLQRATVDAIHAMFPEPVAYIDRCGMISAYPRAGFFMSSWGIEKYRADGRAVLHDAIIAGTPRFVIVNSSVLAAALVAGSPDVPPAYRLMAQDRAALRDNFVHHWGAIWVAGKQVDRLEATSDRVISVSIPGPYTLEAPRAVAVDGTVHAPDAVFELAAGAHALRSADGMQDVTLRWGDHLPRPPVPAPDAPLFEGF